MGGTLPPAPPGCAAARSNVLPSILTRVPKRSKYLCPPRWLCPAWTVVCVSRCCSCLSRLSDLCVCPLSPTDLNKHQRYEIRMSVYNAVGEGPLSAPQEVFVGEAGESRRKAPCPTPPPTPLSWVPQSPVTLPPSSPHRSTPQRGCPRCHSHTARCDVGATATGKPEWRHPGV